MPENLEPGAKLQLAFARIVREVELRDRIEMDPGAVLAELGLDEATRAGILSCSPRRLLAYHEMVHKRLARTIGSFLGRAAVRLGEERLRGELDEFLAACGPKTPYLRDVPAEFLAWVEPRWAEDPSVPEWIPELARHEVLLRAVRNDPREVGAALERKIDLERPIVCNATTRLVRYRFAVHRLPKRLPERMGANDAPEPTEEPGGGWVIAYRHPEEDVRFVDIKPRSAHLLRLLLDGKSLREALFGACEATGEQLDDRILSVTAVTLADLADRHVLLGGA